MIESMADTPQPMCLPGLHQAVAGKIEQRIAAPRRVLDIAAGSGAFTRRLIDMGISPIANDADGSKWGVPEIDLMNVDLNTDFAEAFADSGIDAIAAIEVIEHLDNPRAFLRQCCRIIPSGGFMFVTTPNVTSAASRGMFLRSGRTVFFARSGPCAGDHITLLPWWILQGHAEAAGWEVVETAFAGRYANQGFRAHLSQLLAAFLGRYDLPGEKEFGCTVMTLRKN
jgi:SAM-dependent methyltransferase